MKLYILFLFILCLTITKCDLPVHCLAKNIAGSWKFSLSASESNFPSCGHQHPDRNTDHLFQDYKNNFQTNETFFFSLNLPNNLSNKEGKIVGTWTMVYDEGFEIRADHKIFFAFSKYQYNGNSVPQDKDDEETEGYYSLCNETFIGWYHDEVFKLWGCFYAEKTDDKQEKTIVGQDQFLKSSETMKIVERRDLIDKNNQKNNGPIPVSQNQGIFDNIMRLYERFQQNEELYEIPHKEYLHGGSYSLENDEFKPDFRFIEYINDERISSPWKAKFHDFMSNKTHTQMKKLLGITHSKTYKYKISFLESASQTFLHQPKHRKTLKKNSSPQQNTLSSSENVASFGKSSKELPKNFDWRSFNGINYDTPVRSQGDCGSCYVLSTISMIEARIRIKSKLQQQPFLSVAGALSCSFYNQGCNGGYPFLIAKEGFERGFFEESCSPLLSDQNCDESCYERKVWKIKEYGYVGDGFYGSCSEEKMMREIYEKGPIVVAINASPDLYYYSSGVFITNPTKYFSQSNERDDIKPWIYTNHAVVCVGWGETFHDGNLLKYWILKNSWGGDWGEKGYFKILRGKNLAAVEHQGVFADPLIMENENEGVKNIIF